MKQAKIVGVQPYFKREDAELFGRVNRWGVEWLITYKIAGNKRHQAVVWARDELEAFKKGLAEAEKHRKSELKQDVDAWETIRKYMPKADLPETEIRKKRKEI
jgi:hypothetical protein